MYLFKMKRRVLLVDLDPQSNATRGSGIEASTIQNSSIDVLVQRYSDGFCWGDTDDCK